MLTCEYANVTHVCRSSQAISIYEPFSFDQSVEGFVICNMYMKLNEYSHYAASQDKDTLQLQLKAMDKVSSTFV